MSQDPDQPSDDSDFFNPDRATKGDVARALLPEAPPRTTLLDAGRTTEPRPALGPLVVEARRDPLKATDDYAALRESPGAMANTSNELSVVEVVGDPTRPDMAVFNPEPPLEPIDPQPGSSAAAPESEVDEKMERLLHEFDKLDAAKKQPPAIIVDKVVEVEAIHCCDTDPPPPQEMGRRPGASIVAGILAFGLVVVAGLRFLSGPRETTIDTPSQPPVTHIVAPAPAPTPTAQPRCRLLGNLTLATAAQHGYTIAYVFHGETPNAQTRVCRR